MLYKNPKPKHSKPTKQNQNNIWKYIRKGSQNHNIFREKKWKDKITNLDFNKIWKNTYFLYSQPHTKDLPFIFLHYVIETNNFVYKISRDKTGLTPNWEHCHNVEDNIHLFTACSRIKKIWRYLQPTHKKLTKRQYTPQQHVLTLSVNNLNFKNKKLMLTLTQIPCTKYGHLEPL